MPNEYFDALGRKPREPRKKRPTSSHVRSPKQELEVARRLLTPASGAKDLKGDIRAFKQVRIECKTTKHGSFSVSLAMLRKLEDAALAYGELPVFVIEFNDGAGNKVADLCVCPSYVLDGLCEK
jgi:hypothetical protein